MRAIDELIGLLRVRRLGNQAYEGHNPRESLPFVFGGLVAAQALAAAAATVPAGREMHSLHAYFVRPGDPGRPLIYRVETIHDGGSFSLRRVVADQGGEPIFVVAVSFHRAEPGLDHQIGMPPAPRPEDLPTFDTWVAPYRDRLPRWWTRDQPIDLRFVGEPPLAAAERRAEPPQQTLWMRAAGELPADPLLHACLAVYASDLTLLDAVVLSHGLAWYGGESRLRSASLDHSMWFHRPVRMDDWLLYVQESPSMTGVRGLARGSIFHRDGALAVSVAQEGLIRVVDPAQAADAGPGRQRPAR
jgi:acyl-CoA thioesterase-2